MSTVDEPMLSADDELRLNKFHREQRILDEQQSKEAMVKMMRDLAEPFPAEMERTLTKSGVALTYIPVSEAINRMNRVVGVDSWSSEIISCQRDPMDPDFVIAQVRVTVNFRGSHGLFGSGPVVKDGIGGQKIKRNKRDEIVDLGDEFKGAVSDALKKALQQFGVGLYLARDVDAIEMDEVMYADESPRQVEAPKPVVHTAPASTPDVADAYERFKEIRDRMDDAQRQQLRDWWKAFSGGRDVPRPSEFTKHELDALIVEALRIQFDGTVSINRSAEN
jgi:hypothetical protein